MAVAAQSPGVIRFGVFEASPSTGELHKSGLKVKLQDQSFRVLLALLEHPRQLVTREELHRKLWSGSTFVDFEHGLNTAINKLREALGDSADNPRFVETIPRRGYRFIAPVQCAPSQPVETAPGRLAAGTRLGPYEVVAQIGAGAMGEVYRARDTRLNRDVALKVLPPSFADDSERLKRFEREARATASLNHPNLLAVFDVGSQGGCPYIVSELLKGETLRERLRGGPIPAGKVVDYSVQIANGLAAAHAEGIIHRDLKPENIFLANDGLAKILDFGLAKVTEVEAASETPQQAGTATGQVLGTLGYMSPEQASGSTADARSDIFALGAILYEMLSGRRAFGGNSPAEVLSETLSSEPPPLSVSGRPMPALEMVVRHCLEKKPTHRFQSAGDVAFALKSLSSSVSVLSSPAPRHRSLRMLVLASYAIITTVVAAFVMLYFPVSRAKPQTVHFTIQSPIENADLIPVISPDGRTIALWGQGGLWVRSLDSLTFRKLLASDIATGKPFWSPDSQYIAFFTQDKLLRTISANGGPPETVCAFDGELGAWGPDGTLILQKATDGPLYRVAAGGGTPEPITELRAGEQTHAEPQFLPDKKHFLFFAFGTLADGRKGEYVQAIDSRERYPVGSRSHIPATYAPGWLLYFAEGGLKAERFDEDALRVSGNPATVSVTGAAYPYTVSQNGVLVYRAESMPREYQLNWRDRDGRLLSTVPLHLLNPGPAANISVSPDGRRVVIAGAVTGDLWLLDTETNGLSQLTRYFGDGKHGGAGDPVWAPDSKRIVYETWPPSAPPTGEFEFWELPVNEGDAKRIFHSKEISVLDDWSPDGRLLLFRQFQQRTEPKQLFALEMGGSATPNVLTQTPSPIDQVHVSPNGRWIAYNTLVSLHGNLDLYVDSFPGFGERRRVAAGAQPIWRADNKELFYVAACVPTVGPTCDATLMAVDVNAGGTLSIGSPHKLFSANIDLRDVSKVGQYAASRDGTRFLLVEMVRKQDITTHVVMNWYANLEK